MLLNKLMATLFCTALLTGCNQPASNSASEPPAAQPQADVKDSEPVIPVAAAQTVSYTCLPEKLITATYDNSQPDHAMATLTIDGKSYQLHAYEVASGAGYSTEQGINPDQGMVWHTKGDSALLTTMTLDHTAKPEDEKTLFECTAQQAAATP